MQFLHKRDFLDGNQCVRVDCDTQCNILLMDDTNFNNYKNGRSYRFANGGYFKEFPAILVPPYSGNWNITLDLAGGSANIEYSINVITIPS